MLASQRILGNWRKRDTVKDCFHRQLVGRINKKCSCAVDGYVTCNLLWKTGNVSKISRPSLTLKKYNWRDFHINSGIWPPIFPAKTEKRREELFAPTEGAESAIRVSLKICIFPKREVTTTFWMNTNECQCGLARILMNISAYASSSFCFWRVNPVYLLKPWKICRPAKRHSSQNWLIRQ